MDRNAKTQRKMQVFFSICHLRVFQIFGRKTFYRNQIGYNRQGPLALVGRGVKRNCISNCLLQNAHFEFGESRLGTQIGNVKGKAFCAKVMERNEDQKNEEKWVERQKSSICHLSVPDFRTKNSL